MLNSRNMTGEIAYINRGNPKEEVGCGAEVAEPLGQGKVDFAVQQRIFDAQNLGHAPGPSHLLTHVGGKLFGGQPRYHNFVVIEAAVPLCVQPQGSVAILSDRFGGDAPHLQQGTTAHHRRRPAKKKAAFQASLPLCSTL